MDWAVGRTYQGKDYAHFTYAFKSYAHYFYTSQQELEELEEIRRSVLEEMGAEAVTDLDRKHRIIYNQRCRDIAIRDSDLKCTVSARLSDSAMLKRYPDMVRVFKGNGYGVWEKP